MTRWPRAILLDFYGTVVDEDMSRTLPVCEQLFRTAGGAATPSEIDDYWDGGPMAAMLIERPGEE